MSKPSSVSPHDQLASQCPPCEAQAENAELRTMLARAISGDRLYADDGELHDCSCAPPIDFRRDSVKEIQRKLAQRAIRATRSIFYRLKDEEIEKGGEMSNADKPHDAACASCYANGGFDDGPECEGAEIAELRAKLARFKPVAYYCDHPGGCDWMEGMAVEMGPLTDGIRQVHSEVCSGTLRPLYAEEEAKDLTCGECGCTFKGEHDEAIIPICLACGTGHPPKESEKGGEA